VKVGGEGEGGREKKRERRRGRRQTDIGEKGQSAHTRELGSESEILGEETQTRPSEKKRTTEVACLCVRAST